MALSPHFDPHIHDHPSWPWWMPDHQGITWKYGNGDAAFISPPPPEERSPKTSPWGISAAGRGEAGRGDTAPTPPWECPPGGPSRGEGVPAGRPWSEGPEPPSRPDQNGAGDVGHGVNH